MAALDDLIRQVQDESLRRRLMQEADTLRRQKKFGLVFEEHIPECVLLHGVAIRRGSTVVRRDGDLSQLFRVERIEGEQAYCRRIGDSKAETIDTAELVVVARFGEAIYPYLQPVDSICTADPSESWHTLIEADNYHALQLLDYLYHGKVDCIYIDPPYNSGARDWKYNNNYVDSSDQYRHSKWLSMMEKRLRLAKRLLNPQDSVLIVTIDEKEYLHLGCMLEELFPEARIQMVSTSINPANVAKEGEFGRSGEYIFFLYLGEESPEKVKLNREWVSERGRTHTGNIRWDLLKRSGTGVRRQDSPGGFYPIYIDKNNGKIEEIGDPLPLGVSHAPEKGNLFCLLPIRYDGSEGRWQWSVPYIKQGILDGRVKIGGNTNRGFTVYRLARGEYEKVLRGEFNVTSRGINNEIIVDCIDTNYVVSVPGDIWKISSHDSTQYGTRLLLNIFLGKRFPFPKSLYAVHDTIRFFVANKPDALIVDFFAGSGTTLHAVNLLNKEDGGHRRCIMVTNNEVSEEEATALTNKGYRPGDEEWERLGIARYVTWPRTTCSIMGKDINGQPIKGEYLTYLTEEKTNKRIFKQLSFYIPDGRVGKDVKKQIVMLMGKDKLPQSKVTDDCPFIVDEDYSVAILFDDRKIEEWLDAIDGQDHLREFYIVTQNNKLFKQAKAQIEEMLHDYTKQETVKYPMQDGFKANVEYFKLGFLDKTAVSLGRQFREVLPLLWLKAGAKGKRPEISEEDNIPPILIAAESGFAVLTDETQFGEFAEQLEQYKDINMVFIVTDSNAGFNYMNNELAGRIVVQLYKNYLDNFTINQYRNIH